MCAIAGVFRAAGVNPSPVTAMARSLAHRGPDAHTVRRYGGQKPYAALGIERLAIVDLDGGGQPTADPSGRWRVILNGEIYNHEQIRRELIANGVTLRSRSDTEVLAALIAQNGLDRALSQCHGMFALAALDTRERRLFLVRDRMGVKPLHWTTLADGTTAFASEIKGILAHPEVPRTLNSAAISAFLLLEYVPTPLTVYANIHKVEPGTWVEIDDSGIRKHRWWTPPIGLSGRPGNFERWAKSLHGVLQVAVHRRMDADVPVGYLLSGGLDSAAVAALASQRSNEPIHTFSMQVQGAGFDESEAAATTAAALGATHIQGHIGPDDLVPTLDAIMAAVDEPLADSSLLATWRLMELVRTNGFKCVQSGDGADETFGGYPTYPAHRMAGPAGPARAVLSRAMDLLPTTHDGVTNDYMARRFVDGLGLPWHRRHQVWMGAWLPHEVEIAPAVWDIVDAHADHAGKDSIARAMFMDQRMYLADGVLVKVDRAAGAHGIEVRSPFLDHSVTEIAAQMGTGHHIRGMDGKRVLRAAVTEHLPAETLHRKKKGFGVPVGPWLRGPCTHLLDGLPDRLGDHLSSDTLRTVIDEHRNGQSDHRRRLWSAVVLDRWLEGPHGPSR